MRSLASHHHHRLPKITRGLLVLLPFFVFDLSNASVEIGSGLVQQQQTSSNNNETEARRKNTTTITEQYLLRGSPSHVEHVERIIDRDALKDLNGADPKDNEFVFHPPGHEANVVDYPFFGHWQFAMCGSSVVHDDILLTAGHCGAKATEPHKRKQVRMLNKYMQQGGIVRNIAHLDPHPDFYRGRQIYDFQLLKTQKSVLVDEEGKPTGVKVVTLNKDPKNPAPGDPIQAMGFGTVTPDKTTGNSQVLMDVSLQAFSTDHCAHQYGKELIRGDIMVCVGTLDGKRDTCQGDSGGPMMAANNVQIGVVSWGEGCAQADRSGLASRVSAVTDWIEQEICRLSAMPPDTCKTPTTSYDNRLPEEGEGEFDLQITVMHDNAPAETAWSFTHRDSMSLLYFQPFDSVPKPFVDVTHVFHDLKAGSYFFGISDRQKDGLCCEFGEGGIVITNPKTKEVLWENNGEFKEFLSVTLELDSSGSVIDHQEGDAWINPSVATSESNADGSITSKDEIV